MLRWMEQVAGVIIIVIAAAASGWVAPASSKGFCICKRREA
jgi:hypothetical protein